MRPSGLANDRGPEQATFDPETASARSIRRFPPNPHLIEARHVQHHRIAAPLSPRTEPGTRPAARIGAERLGMCRSGSRSIIPHSASGQQSSFVQFAASANPGPLPSGPRIVWNPFARTAPRSRLKAIISTRRESILCDRRRWQPRGPPRSRRPVLPSRPQNPGCADWNLNFAGVSPNRGRLVGPSRNRLVRAWMWGCQPSCPPLF